MDIYEARHVLAETWLKHFPNTPLGPNARAAKAKLQSLHGHVRNKRQISQALKAIDVIAKGDDIHTKISAALDRGPSANYRDSDSDGFFVGANNRLFPADVDFDTITPIVPNNGKASGELLIAVNGIMTRKDLQFADLQDLANKTGASVIGIHNSTDGLWTDLAQCLADKLEIGRNPPVDTTANLLYKAIQTGRRLSLVGHSQGALILSRALLDVRNRLILEDGLSAAAAEEKLKHFQVETYGGAARNFVDGPEYIHYVNLFDLVPMITGVGFHKFSPFVHAGNGAVVHFFSEAHLPSNMPSLFPDHMSFREGIQNWFARSVDRMVHGPQDVYWKHRRSPKVGNSRTRGHK